MELQHTLGTDQHPVQRDQGAAWDRTTIPSEIPIKSRLEVRTGRLLASVCREAEGIVGMLREHAPSLSGTVVDEASLEIVDELIIKLKDALAKLASKPEVLSPSIAVRCSQKGKLYDLARKLVWIAAGIPLRSETDDGYQEPRAGSDVRTLRPVPHDLLAQDGQNFPLSRPDQEGAVSGRAATAGRFGTDRYSSRFCFASPENGSVTPGRFAQGGRTC